MTTKTDEQERADFEAWYEREYSEAVPCGFSPHGYYLDARIQLLFRCYQAGRAALLAERDALRVALEDELNWHETQYKVLSKQPDAYSGHNWGRWIQHQEHAAVIRAALGQRQEEE